MKHCDVVIVGGGLAGLCLARQLQIETTGLRVIVIESNTHPVPVAAHKVGESTVEIGAHYLAETLGLRSYLDDNHLKKFGLRCFFGDNADIAQADELGASSSLPVSSYQLDRGLLENHLGEILRGSDVEIHTGARVKDVTFDADGSGNVTYQFNDQKHVITSRWVIDATGRRGLLRKRMSLKTENGLKGNAVWFRVDQRIRVDDWSDDAEWQGRICRGERWLSTNHFMGQGYWVWLIPLSSGTTSVGVVADANAHCIKNFTSFERLERWLSDKQPQLAKAVMSALDGKQPMDFAWVRNYSYGCSELYSRRKSNQLWALTGEAGLFLDPFYSPGMDFIAYGNTFITDLVRRESAGENIDARKLLYQQTYLSFYESSLLLYRDQYNGFGNFRLMSLKTIWDYSYYWGVLGLLFFNNAITDTDLLTGRSDSLAAIRQVHKELQQQFRRLASNKPVVSASASFMDQAAIPLLQRLNRELTDKLTGAELGGRLDANLICLHQLASEISAALDDNQPPAMPATLIPSLSQQLANT
ncbi:MAG: NAD(P)/FAD-dependent oxidoreductase [Granulosicoccus sp.]